MLWSTLKGGVFYFSLLLAGPAMAQTIFTEVTKEALPLLSAPTRQAIGDVDNDGWPDLWAIGFDDANRLYLMLNQGNGRFVQQNSIFEDDTVGGDARAGGIFGDYDNDGDLDLFIPVGAWIEGYGGPDVLLRNDRGVLREVTLGTGLEVERVNTDNAIWLDYDRDGYLDLYLGHFMLSKTGDPSLRNRLYRSKGDGTFVDVTAQVGLDVQLQEYGGSGQGMVAGDFDDDGWPDLYIAVFRGDNRLFLNNGQGGFADATTREIADVGGEAFGVAVGDIDNDGDLDIFQPSGAGTTNLQRSLLLLNLGKGQFLDVTEGVGLGGIGDKTGQTRGAALADLDNDGDLDLVTTVPAALFLNDGSGFFSEATARLGTARKGNGALTLGDLDLDGFLDIWIDSNTGDRGILLHNKGNDNHWLRVELVGTRSNRSGIGARLIATSGDLRQMREIFGGMGLYQDEMVAHFGLGERTQVDRLEVRWPSGQVDVLTDISVDQKIRVIEGRTAYQVVRPPTWEAPDSLVAGTMAVLKVTVQPALFEPGAEITSVIADLSELGGPESVALKAADEGTYRMEPLSLAIEGPNGLRTLSAMIDQQTSLGPYWTRLSRNVAVLPAGDLLIFGDEVGADWQVQSIAESAKLDLQERETVYQGQQAMRVETDAFTVDLLPAMPVDPVGYSALRLAFNPGDAVAGFRGAFNVAVKTVEATDPFYVKLLYGSQEGLRLDMDQKEWQVVEIPLKKFGVQGKIEDIRLIGSLKGRFYLDDIRLVAATPPPATVVEEERTTALPQTFSLSQNFPNPFNSDTLIRFALPERGEVELAVYNLAGQWVVRLAEGMREAGSYTVRWDGRDGQERVLASGVYLCRLRVGEKVETRKLALVR